MSPLSLGESLMSFRPCSPEQLNYLLITRPRLERERAEAARRNDGYFYYTAKSTTELPRRVEPPGPAWRWFTRT
ncbi:MAG: hypothetical protein JW759_01540 [Candidatus Coatesbacteria bacterium]|nr:hypothetical protein [Candidatus Coatesbacteria bacterium]